MKIKIFCIFFVCFICSCKKDKKTPDNNSVTHKVTFNVSGFSVSKKSAGNAVTRINSVGADSVAGIVSLYYLVYNSAGGLVHKIMQTSAQSNFGSITDNLSAGTYSVIVIAGSDPSFSISQSISDLPLSKAQCFYDVYNEQVSNYYWRDTFYKKLTLTVAGGDVSENIVLSRIVGKLEFNIEDAFPASAKKVTYTFKKEYPYLNISNTAPDSVLHYSDFDSSPYVNTVTTTVTLPANAIGQTNVKFNHLVLNTIHPLSVTITCYDATSAIIGQAIINNVVIQKNEKTILSGKLFGSSAGFTVSLDPVWGTDTTTITF